MVADFHEYQDYDAVGLAELVRSRQVGPVDLIDAAIARIEGANPVLNAVVDHLYDEARRRTDTPRPGGPLAGVPILLKDMIPRAATRLSYASAFFKDYVADHSHPVVDRFEAAGMIVVGRTNASELGLMASTEPVLYGPTRNPWDLSRSPGGSSGGSAAAVAAGIVPVAHGNDGGGSLRSPASACGMFGFKPSRGRTAQAPDIDPSGLVYEHVITRSVRDSAAVLDATNGNLAEDRWRCPSPARHYLEEVVTDPGRLRIAVATGANFGLPCNPEIETAVRTTALWCESLGHDIDEVHFDLDVEGFTNDFLVLWAEIPTAVMRMLTDLLGTRPDRSGFESFTWDLVDLGEHHSVGNAWLAWRGPIQRTTAALTSLLTEFDVLLSPVTGELTPPIGHLDPNLGLETLRSRSLPYAAFTAPANTSGLPAMSMPLHQSRSGLPIGVHAVGRWGEEATLFRLVGQLEQAHPWSGRRPPASLNQ